MSKSDELLKQHKNLRESYFLFLKHINIVGSAIETWMKSKDPARQKHIDSLTLKLRGYEDKAEQAKSEILKVEALLRKSHTKFTPLLSKSIKIEKK